MQKENFEFIRYIQNENDAIWADPEELKKISENPNGIIRKINVETEECEKAGIPIMSDGSVTYVDGSDTHSMIFGATGSKKTRLFAMPMLKIFALAGESFIATDPKGELFDKTSGFVENMGYKPIVLNFRDLESSDYWNPFDIPYRAFHEGHTERAISLLYDFLLPLFERQLKCTKDTYFIELGIAQAFANLLFFIATASPHENNIYNFVEFFFKKATPEGTRECYEHIAKGSVAAINYLMALANEKVEKTFANVTSTCAIAFRPFIIRKSLCQILSKSSYDINDMFSSKLAIYVIVPDENTSCHFLVTTFIKQVYETLISIAQQAKDKKLPVRVNFLLDEFCNIPTIPDMPSMISAARSRNIRFFLFAQSLFQLEQKYDKDAHTIKGNCDNWVFLTSREEVLLKEISFLCGQTSKGPLISTSELQRLNKEIGEALILFGRENPLVTELPDIDEYRFKEYSAMEKTAQSLPDIRKYDIEKVLSDINSGNVPIPFSKEVYGEDLYSDGSIKAKKNNKDLFDW